ncbi:MAG: DUF3021 domain-containing protein [Lachnospiraceae bacterium]|nr:DUF3021 domain-containing protein [Lachnospiraceae bacterium]
MRKISWKRMLNVITSVTTGVLVACIFWNGITLAADGESFLEAKIPYLTLVQILVLGILCGVESEFIMPHDEYLPPKKNRGRYLMHYAVVTGTALVCGYFYEWYELSVSGILLMCFTSAAIYLFTSYLKYRSGKKEADEMNEYLWEYHKKK